MPNLETLQLGKNRISTVSDLQHLVECEQCRVLDLSDNRIKDPKVVDIFTRMKSLRVLYLYGNPVCGEIPFYRQTLINAIPALTFLDRMPVFDKERAIAAAWSVFPFFFRCSLDHARNRTWCRARGGREAADEERRRWIDKDRRKTQECVDSKCF